MCVSVIQPCCCCHITTGMSAAKPIQIETQKPGVRSKTRSFGETSAKATISAGKTSIICLLRLPKPRARPRHTQAPQDLGASIALQKKANAKVQASTKGESMVKKRFSPTFPGVHTIRAAARKAVLAPYSRRASFCVAMRESVPSTSGARRMPHSLLFDTQPTTPMSQPIMGGLL